MTSSPTRLVLFDIDGTLVLTGGAGKRAMDRAFADVFGIANAFADVPMGGRTDRYLIERGLERWGMAATAAALEAFRRHYLRHLAESIHEPGTAPRDQPGVSRAARRPRQPAGRADGAAHRQLRGGRAHQAHPLRPVAPLRLGRVRRRPCRARRAGANGGGGRGGPWGWPWPIDPSGDCRRHALRHRLRPRRRAGSWRWPPAAIRWTSCWRRPRPGRRRPHRARRGPALVDDPRRDRPAAHRFPTSLR